MYYKKRIYYNESFIDLIMNIEVHSFTGKDCDLISLYMGFACPISRFTASFIYDKCTFWVKSNVRWMIVKYC